MKIIAAGHICLDITPIFPTGRDYGTPAELLQPGSLILTDGASVHTGGSVANTGLAMKLLGADVKLLAKVGGDAFGELVKSIAASYGAGGLLSDSNCATSYSVILAVPGQDRLFLHDPGANDSFCNADVPDAAFEDAELIHFGYPPLMERIRENGGAELAALFRRAREKGLKTSLDLCSVDPNSPEAKLDWKTFLKNVLPLVDYFLPSYEELAFMLGETDPEKLARTCREYGAGTVVIKCGEQGLVYLADGKFARQEAYPVKRVASATGAGDAAIAAFLVAITAGKTVEEAVCYAAAEGACAVTAYDALGGLRTLPELDRIIAAGRVD